MPDELTTAELKPLQGWRLWLIVGASALVVIGVSTAAVQVTGPAPEPAERLLEKVPTPPPMVLGDATPATSAMAVGAKALLRGDYAAARSAFSGEVQRAGTSEAEVGLLLSDWTTRGPRFVERRLATLAEQDRSDPSVWLHAGLVQLYLGSAEADDSLRLARAAAERARRFDLYRRADDVLHPELVPGYPPLLTADVVPAGVDGKQLAAVRAALRRGDRPAAAAAATALVERSAPSARAWTATVAAIARFDKDRPARTTSSLCMRSDEFSQLHCGLAQLWSSRRAAAVATLDRLASGTGRQAAEARRIVAALKRA